MAFKINISMYVYIFLLLTCIISDIVSRSNNTKLEIYKLINRRFPKISYLFNGSVYRKSDRLIFHMFSIYYYGAILANIQSTKAVTRE